MVQTAVETGLQFTAHSVGDGAVHALLDVYEDVDQANCRFARRGRASRIRIS